MCEVCLAHHEIRNAVNKEFSTEIHGAFWRRFGGTGEDQRSLRAYWRRRIASRKYSNGSIPINVRRSRGFLCGVAEGPLGIHAAVAVSVVPLHALRALLQHVFIAQVLDLSGTERLFFPGTDDSDGAPGAYRVVGPTLVSSMYEGRQSHRTVPMETVPNVA